jgi:hypothetical protein
MSDADAALSSTERDAAHDTDWCKTLANELWFQGSNKVYDVFGSRFIA